MNTLRPDPQPAPRPKRPRRLKRKALWAVTIILLVTVFIGDSLPPQKQTKADMAAISAGRRFGWVSWEAGAVWQEGLWWLKGRPVPGDEARQKEQVLAFVEKQRQISQLAWDIRREYAALPEGASPPQSLLDKEQTLADWRQSQETVAPQIERIVAHQIEQTLALEGLVWMGDAWPPVAFKFVDLPTYLIVSPRDDIYTFWSTHLQPNMPIAERVTLEKQLESEFDVSALVDNLGGIGSWPTMVERSTSLGRLFEVVAHEWTHNYLLLRPLGWHYGDNRDLTTMNETVASIVGEEVSRLTLARLYPELLAPPPEADDAPPPPEAEAEGETFAEAMRRIRLRVDDLLSQGRVDEAEAVMDAERLKLAENGYYIRRLNQAYFAFHGSYATGPVSVDPIGPWMSRLRAQSGSLKAFLQAAGRMQSLDDLLAVVE